MRYLTRTEVMRRLRLSLPASYRIIGTSRWKLIAASDVLAILNQSRRGGQRLIVNGEVPELVNADEVAEMVNGAGGEVSPKGVLSWTKRKLNPVPHYRLNSHCRRFEGAAVLSWLDRKSQIVRRG